MNKFGGRSATHLDNVEPALSLVAYKAMSYQVIDFAIIESIRTKEKQNEYYNASPQKSKVKYPNGKHNVVKIGEKAKAFDAVPYVNGVVSWNKLHCCVLAGVILGTASELGVKIRWGGNWDMDGEPVTDQDFQDLVHFELVNV